MNLTCLHSLEMSRMKIPKQGSFKYKWLWTLFHYDIVNFRGSTYKDNLEPDQVSGGLSSLTQSRQTVSVYLSSVHSHGLKWISLCLFLTFEESVYSIDFSFFFYFIVTMCA